MLDYKTIINKHYGLGISGTEIAKQIGASKSGVNKFLKAFKESGKLSYPLPEGITNEGIAIEIYGNIPGESGRDLSFVYPDYETVFNRMNTRNNMTLVYLWNCYKEECIRDGKKYYQYRQFCEHYNKWCNAHSETLHIGAVIGQKMEVDFAGKSFDIIDPLTGELSKVIVFVAILPYSQYIYAEGMLSIKEPQWIEVNNHALEYFGGVPAICVCDNCKQAVIANKDWISPDLNKDYAEWAEHNHTVIMPAKVRRPKYKSSVENAVGILEKGIFHDLEEKQFFSIEEFNAELWRKVEKLNRKPFQKKEHSRYDYWMEEKSELMPLPSAQYQYAERKIATVSNDFHIRFDNAYYSVNHKYLHQKVNVKATATTVMIYSRKGEFIREWPRAQFVGQWHTDPDDLPDKYKGYTNWSGTYFLNKAAAIGENTEAVISKILASRKYEVQTYRMCLGILEYSKKYTNEILEECCRKALECGRVTYTAIKNSIVLVSEDMGFKKGKSDKNSDGKRGGFAMNRDSFNIEKLLEKSSELVNDNEKEADSDDDR